MLNSSRLLNGVCVCELDSALRFDSALFTYSTTQKLLRSSTLS